MICLCQPSLPSEQKSVSQRYLFMWHSRTKVWTAAFMKRGNKKTYFILNLLMTGWGIINFELNSMSSWLNCVLDYTVYFATLFLFYLKWNEKKFKVELQSNMKFTFQKLEHKSLPKESNFVALNVLSKFQKYLPRGENVFNKHPFSIPYAKVIVQSKVRGMVIKDLYNRKLFTVGVTFHSVVV